MAWEQQPTCDHGEVCKITKEIFKNVSHQNKISLGIRCSKYGDYFVTRANE
jgi:hypothetical protein